MDFINYIENLDNMDLEPKNVLLFIVASVQWIEKILEISSTHFTMHCQKCLFHMDIHIKKFGSVLFVDQTSRWNGTSENITKKNDFSSY